MRSRLGFSGRSDEDELLPRSRPSPSPINPTSPRHQNGRSPTTKDAPKHGAEHLRGDHREDRGHEAEATDADPVEEAR